MRPSVHCTTTEPLKADVYHTETRKTKYCITHRIKKLKQENYDSTESLT